MIEPAQSQISTRSTKTKAKETVIDPVKSNDADMGAENNLVVASGGIGLVESTKDQKPVQEE